MTESKKAISILLIGLGLLAAFVFACPLPRESVGCGYLPTVVALSVTLAAGFALWRLCRIQDTAPDFLARLTGRYLDGAGLCFHLVPLADQGVMVGRIYFQNRFERPCHGTVSFRPFHFFSRGVPALTADIDCAGGAFGFVQIPWQLPKKAAGKTVKLQAFAVAEYPQGRGQQLRHRNAVFVCNAPTLRGQLKGFRLGGTYAYSKLVLPEPIPESTTVKPPVARILWIPGDQQPANIP